MMNRVIAILCLLLTAMSFAADKASGTSAEKNPTRVRWMDYTEALEKAQKDPRLIFVDLYADWCVPCRIMDKNVYSDVTVSSVLNAGFYPVKLDADSQDSIMCDGIKNTVQRCYFDVWELNALPAFVLVAPKGLSILTVTQSMSADEMVQLLGKFLKKEKEWIAR